MRKLYKIVYLNAAVLLVLTFIFMWAVEGKTTLEFAFSIGIVGLLYSILCLLTGLLLLLFRKPEEAKGFLLSAGLIFLIGVAGISPLILEFSK